MGYSNFKYNIPDVNRTYVYGRNGIENYSKPHIAKGNDVILSMVNRLYGGLINKWGAEFKIPNDIIAPLMCVESMGEVVPKKDNGVTGLMQISPSTVYEIIAKWNVKVPVPLSDKTKAYILNICPSYKTWGVNKLMDATIKEQIQKGLSTSNEFNIAMGVATLRWNIEAFSTDGDTGGLQKAIIVYNAGYYGVKGKLKGKTTTEQLVNNKAFKSETRAYLLKMFGVNGFMDLYLKQLKK